MASLFSFGFGSNTSSLTSSTAGATSSVQSEQPHLETPEMELPNETTAVDSSVNTVSSNTSSNVENNAVEISDVEIVNGVEVEQTTTQSTQTQTQAPVQPQDTVPLQPMTQSTPVTAQPTNAQPNQPATAQPNKGTYFYSNGITYKTFSNMDEFLDYLDSEYDRNTRDNNVNGNVKGSKNEKLSFGDGKTTKTFSTFLDLIDYILPRVTTKPVSTTEAQPAGAPAAQPNQTASQPNQANPSNSAQTNRPTETTVGPFTYSDGKISETFPTLLELINFLEKSCETEPLNPSTQFTFGDGKLTKTFSTYNDLVNYITNYTFDFVGNRYNAETNAETGAKYNPKLMYFDLMFGNSGKCDCARCSAEANAANANNANNANSADNANKAGQSSQSNTTDQPSQPSQSDEKKENPLLDFFQKMTELIKTKCTCPSCTERRNTQTTTPTAATSESQVPVSASAANNATLPTAPPASANIKPLPNLSNVYANLSNCSCVLCSAMQGRRPTTTATATAPNNTDLPSSGVQATNVNNSNTTNPIDLTYLANSTNLEYKEGPVLYNSAPTNSAPPKCNDCMDQPEYSETTGDSEVTEDTMDSPNDDAARDYISPCRNAGCSRCADAKDEVVCGLEDPRAKYGNNWQNYFNFGSRKTPTTEELYVPLLMNTAFATKYIAEDNANGYLKALTSSNVRNSAQLTEADLYKYFDMDLINSVASATSQASLRVDQLNALYAKVRLEKDMTVGNDDPNVVTYVYGPALLARLHRYINDRYPYQKGIEFHADGLGFTLNGPLWAMN